MNTEQAAALLNGRQYGEEISGEEKLQFKGLGLVAVFGASNDLLEFRGAIHEELGAWNGTTVYLVMKNMAWEVLPEEEFDRYKETLEDLGLEDALHYHKLTTEWCPEKDGEIEMSWRINTEIPHSKFFIMEDGEKYCQGLVFAISAL